VNFHLPISSDIKEYVKWLKGFQYPKIPGLHKEAWMALSYLQSNYHKTADQTAEMVMKFYSGFRRFMRSKEE
jgi:hypothetical protein